MALGTLTGTYRLATVPQVRSVGNTVVASARAAASKSKKDETEPSGYKTLATHWITVEVWDGEAEDFAQLAVGQEFEMFGHPETQEWPDKDDPSKKNSKDVVRVVGFKAFAPRNAGQQQPSFAQASQQTFNGQQNDPWAQQPQQSGGYGQQPSFTPGGGYAQQQSQDFPPF